jgi:hypothetical protein
MAILDATRFRVHLQSDPWGRISTIPVCNHPKPFGELPFEFSVRSSVRPHPKKMPLVATESTLDVAGEKLISVKSLPFIKRASPFPKKKHHDDDLKAEYFSKKARLVQNVLISILPCDVIPHWGIHRFKKQPTIIASMLK